MECNYNSAMLGLGGNIGDVVAAMKQALDMLHATQGIEIVQLSPLYKTPPWGIKNQNWFINACVEVSCVLSPLELLTQCQKIELLLHRTRTRRWGPRTIDIDILTFAGYTSDDPVLTIPHPRMLERAFVLMPLADIALDLEIAGEPVEYWLKKSDKSDIKLLDEKTSWWNPSR